MVWTFKLNVETHKMKNKKGADGEQRKEGEKEVEERKSWHNPVGEI